jgi:hypothetical protein
MAGRSVSSLPIRGWRLHTGRRSRTGSVPPTETVAKACDRVFPERRGWFLEYYEEMRTWAPPGFRDWPEYEDKAIRLSDWWPSMISGLLQTEAYARAYLETYPGTSAEVVGHRLANRMERQRRLFAREVRTWFVVDHAALYRLVGSPGAMVGQMRHLAEVAAMPNVTLQVLPSVGHAALPSGFLIADGAAYTESVVSGQVYVEPETVERLDLLFDSLRSESYRASESAAVIKKAEQIWTGESATTAPTEGLPALRSRRAK